MDAEIAYLLARCRLVIDAIERAEPGPYAAQLRQAVDDTAAARNVRGLRIVRRDLLEMSQALPPADRVALRAALAAQEATDPIHHARPGQRGADR